MTGTRSVLSRNAPLDAAPGGSAAAAHLAAVAVAARRFAFRVAGAVFARVPVFLLGVLPPPRGTAAIAGYQVNTDVSISEETLSVDDAPVYGAALALADSPGDSGRAALALLEPDRPPPGHWPGDERAVSRADPLLRDRRQHRAPVRRARADVGAPSGSLFLPDRINYSNGTSTSLGDTPALRLHDRRGTQHPPLGKAGAARRGSGRRARRRFSNGSIYVGGGAALGVSGGIPIWQWNFLGGLVFSP